MIQMIKLLLSLFFAVGLCANPNDSRELEQLFNRVIPHSLEDSPESEIDFGLFDTSMGEMMLELWYTAKDQKEKFKMEDRIKQYASSCSASFVLVMFNNFERQIPKINSKREIDSVAIEIESLISLTRDAQRKFARIQAEFQPLYDRFNLVYKYMSGLMKNSNSYPVKPLINLQDKKDVIMNHALHLKKCDISFAQSRQKRFIEYLETLRTKHHLTPGLLFDLCREAFTEVIQQRELADKRLDVMAEIESLKDQLAKARDKHASLLNTLNY